MVTRDPLHQLGAAFPAGSLGVQHVHGLGERPLVAPHDVGGFERVLHLAREARWTLQLAGNATRLGCGPTPLRVDLVLSTRALSGVIAYEPGDGTLTARSGCSMAELAQVAASGGFDLTPDVANPARHTLGGILGAGISGIERLARGPLRHHVLGMGVLLADGSRAKTGGRLVKNVTGYDLQRLYAGSRGSLCVILEASLRLFPAARRHGAVRLTLASRAAALQLAQRIAQAGVAPEAVLASPLDAGAWQLLVLLAGRIESVGLELERLRALQPAAELLEEDAARSERQVWRDRLEGDPSSPSLRLSCLPSELEALFEDLDAALEQCSLQATLFSEPCLGSIQIQLPREATEEQSQRLHTALSQSNASMQWSHAAPRLQQGPLEPATTARFLMQGIKAALDPEGLFAGGAFHGQP